MRTFSATYSHDGLEADLAGEVALHVLLELLQLGRVVDVVEGRVVEDAAGRVLGHAGCGSYRPGEGEGEGNHIWKFYYRPATVYT